MSQDSLIFPKQETFHRTAQKQINFKNSKTQIRNVNKGMDFLFAGTKIVFV